MDESRVRTGDFLAITEITKIIETNHYDVAVTATANIPHLAYAAASYPTATFWLIHEYPEGEFAYTKRLNMILSNKLQMEF